MAELNIVFSSTAPTTGSPNTLYFVKNGTGFDYYACSPSGDLRQLETAGDFLSLSDAPSSYSGQASKVVRVNSGETGLEFVTLAGGGDALTTDPLSQFAATTSAQLAGVISDETGSGALVFATSPVLVTPNIGTPVAGTLTNCTSLPISTGVSGLGTGVATALAVNVGSGGAFVVLGGALGTPSSGTLTSCTGLPISTGVSGLGTGVATALAVNVGSAGAVLVLNGALGTPSSGTLTNCTGLPIGGLTGLGTGVGTALAVNVGSSGAFVVLGGALGTPSSGTLTNCTGLPTAGLVDGAVTYAKLQDVSATSRILGRKTAGAGDAEECTLSEILDFIGSAAQGDILYRGASGWARLGAGTSGHFLQTQGAAANPQWAAAAGGGNVSNTGTPADSQIAVWTDATTIEGDSALTFDTTTDHLSTGTGGKVTTGTIELGAASDTTLSRSAAGVLAVEGNNVITTVGTGQQEVIGIAVSDETTALTTGTAKATFRMPYAMTLSDVRATVTTAPTGATLQVDINEGGVSVLSTVLSIDASEKTSETAATAAVISDSALADDSEITIDIDQVGSTVAGAGLKIWLIGTRT